MADEKLNTTPAENPQPSLFDTGPAEAPAPEPPAPEPPAPEKKDAPAQEAPVGAPGDVVVSADQIEKLMAERRAAERAEVEKNEPPTPTPKEKTAGENRPGSGPWKSWRRNRKSPAVAASPRKKKRDPALREGRDPQGPPIQGW